MTASPTNRYRAETLPNGLILVFDYACAWSSCFAIEAGRVVFRHGQSTCAEMQRCAEEHARTRLAAVTA